MDFTLQPKPEVEILPAERTIVSRKQFFVKKKFEKVNKYFFAGHLIRHWKPKADLIYHPFTNENAIQYEYDFNRDVQNCFVEDYAEEVYLRTPPPCFVVIGKCGRSITKLSQEIAKEYGSVLIQVDDIVSDVLKRKTETSKILQRILRLGVSLTLNFILALLSYVAHTPEARHRGYVLCGLPRPPLLHDLSVDQQFNYLFTWENKPTVFINVFFDDEDLFQERTNLFCEIKNSESEKIILFHSKLEESQENEDQTEDEDDDLLPIKEDVFYERDIDVSPSQPRIRLPKDEEHRVWFELELFDNDIRPAIELIKARVDPQYFFTVDSRIGNEFEVVLSRLRLLHIWKVPVPKLFIQPSKAYDLTEGEGEVEMEESFKIDIDFDPDLIDIINDPPETAFLKLFNKFTISPKYRWELSHYNYICPVSLREGQVVEGKSEFAVLFMKYIYFLRDKQCAEKFIQNPRVYALPIRPKPLCRFFILGYPYSGKTTLAQSLATEFSIPIINFKTVLKNDLDRKKNIYQELCRQKAECRETIRLTCQAWEGWKLEEEKRLSLIEDWILFIQVLLSRRIEEFYSSGSDDNASAVELRKEFSPMSDSIKKQYISENSSDSNETCECLGEETEIKEENAIVFDKTSVSQKVEGSTAKFVSTSVKIVQYDNFNFDKDNRNIEKNMFLSSIWKSFSEEERKPSRRSSRTVRTAIELEGGEDFGEYEAYPDGFEFDNESDEYDLVDWCSLLPPQSLSSFLLSKKPYTTRQKRESFPIFLEAASKVYWEPSTLKSQFAKWRIPCFMDIPLCEMLIENPMLLLHYLPEWLKERPLFPDPIDPMHPSILEAGKNAYFLAGCISVKQNEEEMGTLLCNAIEKAEREGIRVTGEVISPGGWVVDDMTYDLKVWNALAREKIFADHVYILVDTDSKWRRIINMWWDLCGRWRNSNLDINSQEISETGESIEENQQSSSHYDKKNERHIIDTKLLQLLSESARAVAEGDEQLDAIYRALVFDSDENQNCSPLIALDTFCFNMLPNYGINRIEDSINEEALLTVQTLTQAHSEQGHISSGVFCMDKMGLNNYEYPLGVQLEIITETLVNCLKRNKLKNEEDEEVCSVSFTSSLEFFVHLLTISNKLFKLKEWLNAVGQDSTVEEIDITGKSQDQVFSDIKQNLMKPFIKKPRELENFEIDEIYSMIRKQLHKTKSNLTESEVKNFEEEEEEEEEDTLIFGESGTLCIVNLEKDILLYGKPQFALKYYGKLYYFYDENSKNKFIENPEKYAPYYSAIRCYPPLRAFLMGPTGSGKSTLAKFLADKCGMVFVDYLQYLIQCLVPHLTFPSKKLTAVGDEALLLGENHSPEARLAKKHFMSFSHKKQKDWLENFCYADSAAIETFFDKVFQKVEPTTVKSFPDMIYKTIESVNLENGDSSSTLLSKTDFNLPEIPYTNMKEISSIINNYIQNIGDLNDYFLDKCLKTLFTKKPYTTQGFVLDGFPMRSSDIDTIVQNNWIPNVVIEISISKEEIIQQNIDKLMEYWDIKLKHEILEEKLIEDALNSFQKMFITFRRNELIKEKREELVKVMEAHTSVDTNEFNNADNTPDLTLLKSQKSEEFKVLKTLSKPMIKKHERSSDFFEPLDKLDSETTEEIEKALREKYPSFSFNPVFENYNDAKERIISNLAQFYTADVNEIEKVKAAFSEVDVTWFEVKGFPSEQDITNLYLEVDAIKKTIKSKGEFAFTMTINKAEKLLNQGFYFLSKFAKWCPVQVYRMKNPIHMFRPLNTKRKVTPIAYRNYIYYVAGEYEKKLFLNDPIKYTFNEPHHPNIPLRVAVIGPPKSGKSTLCKRLQAMFDFKIVTMGSALRFALEKAPGSTLAKSITSYLSRGCFLPLSLKIEALMLCLNEPSCVTQGFVLDGMPFDAAFTQSLAEKGKLPFVIINLVADSYFGKTNRENLDLKQFRLPYKNRANLDSRYSDWDQTYKRFAQWNQNTYNNLYEVNAKLNVVDIFYQAYDIIRKSFFGILYYVEYCVSDRALPLQYLCVDQHEYELRKSSFHSNCPVCWAELNRLNSSVEPPPRSGLVQYLNHFYWICPKHFEKFLKCPKKYFFPNVKKWPEMFPKRLHKDEIEKYLAFTSLHGFGRCPVTRTDFPSNLDWEGSYECGVLYNNEIFLCKNEEMLDRFLAMPWRYCDADTKFEVKRPDKSDALLQLGPPKLTSLPPIGFLEQTVADLIHECLQILGVVRPIYPNVTPTATGCTFIALYLKVNNKNSRSAHLVKEYLDFMLRYCQPKLFLTKTIRYPQVKLEADVEETENEEYVKFDSSAEDEISLDATADLKKSSSDPCWTDTESKTDRKVWSAAYINENVTAMKMTSEYQLIEIPDLPKEHAVLSFQTYTLRFSPLPPISNCLTVLYSCKRNLEIPEKFNYDTLHHSPELFQSPFKTDIAFNPDKRFPSMLYEEKTPNIPSKLVLLSQRTMPDPTVDAIKASDTSEIDPVFKLLSENFFPRFHLLDKVQIPDLPSLPCALDIKPTAFNPHREYTYTILYSEFFRTTHVLRCYEWNECSQFLEYTERYEKNLGLPNVQVDYIFKPRKPASLKSRTSLDSYQREFDTGCKFFVSSKFSDSDQKTDEEISLNESDEKSSLINFFEALVLEKLEAIFQKVSRGSLSYDAFEIKADPLNAKQKIIIQETLPYPPLPWDIISRPYYSYLTLSSIFQAPPLDNIAHERHVSLLDGLLETKDSLKFVSLPSEARDVCQSKAHREKATKPIYFVYDFFNLPWTSFLTYPYSIAYNLDMANDFSSK